jgi:FkbM family methyltransferase
MERSNVMLIVFFCTLIIISLVAGFPYIFAIINDVPADNYTLVNEQMLPLGFNQRLMERMEQYYCSTYISPNAAVLELGGRYGVVSVCINKILQNPYHHLVVEPDKEIHQSLYKNREISNSKFEVLEGIISNKKLNLVHNGYNTHTTDSSVSSDTDVRNYTLDQIIDHYNIPFNTLVVDCEGCYNSFWKENPRFLEKIHTVILENDFTDSSTEKENTNVLLQYRFNHVTSYLNWSVWKKG